MPMSECQNWVCAACSVGVFLSVQCVCMCVCIYRFVFFFLLLYFFQLFSFWCFSVFLGIFELFVGLQLRPFALG